MTVAFVSPQRIPVVADDFSNTLATAGVLSVNAAVGTGAIQSTDGVIETPGDLDLLKVDLVAGQTYFLNATPRAGAGVIDPLLLLWDSALTLIDGNDDATAFTTSSQLRFTAPTTGTYYVQVSDLTDAGTGNYTASAWQVGADLYGATLATAGTATVGTTTTGLLESISDIDILKVTLLAGKVYTFDLSSPTGALDPVLKLLNAAGGEVLFSDDAGPLDSASRIVFRPATSGTYYLQVEDFNEDEGAYMLGASVINSTFNGSSAANTLTGTADADVLYGQAGNDTLKGLAGNDCLDGGTGNDRMEGGTGDDTYVVDSTRDSTVELAGGGVDLVQTGLTSWTLAAEMERLVYTGSAAFKGIGNAGANILEGASGNDTLDGAGGADRLYGRAGNDIYVVDTVNDLAIEMIGQGTADEVQSSVSWTLGANLERLTLTGTAVNGTGNELANLITGNASSNALVGQEGNDALAGGLGNDMLYGGTGDDQLNGGVGIDYLYGEAGRDSFLFNTSLNATTNVDTLFGFSAVDDQIQLENAIFTKLSATGALSANFFRASALGKAADSNDYILFNTTSGALSYDVDGSGSKAAIQFVTIDIASMSGTLTSADFLVI